MKLFLYAPFDALWRGKDPFSEVEKLEGAVYRALEGRRTLRTEVGNRAYFVKIHRGIGWREIFKNLLLLKKPVTGASCEWKAIQRLHEVGIPTMKAVAFGERGNNPACRHSFLITEELAQTVDLENFTLGWQSNPPDFALKYALIHELARMVSAMHKAGVNHRDCYLCHFLLHPSECPKPGQWVLSVIDLHRAQVRGATPKRWRNKDLAALYFSACGIGLTLRDKYRFLRAYFGMPLRDILKNEAPLLGWVQKKAARLYERQQRYGDRL